MSNEIQEFFNEYLPFEINEAFVNSAKSIAFNPIFWNIAAQVEFRTGLLTKLTGGPYNGCYVLAITIFSLGIFRDYLFHQALETQPVAPLLDNLAVKALGGALFVTGNVFVLSSMWALGVTGTYLGDYFGILMDHMVTSFPFSVIDNPMYVGSYLSFLGTSLWYAKSGGLFLSILVQTMYSLALKFEEPFTARIYAERDALRAGEAKVAAKKEAAATAKASESKSESKTRSRRA